MVAATKAKGAAVSARNWKCAPSGMVRLTPGRDRDDALDLALAAPDLARAGHEIPDFLDRPVRDGVRDGAGGELEMRETASLKRKQQPHRSAVGRDRVGRSAQRLGFKAAQR